MSGEARAPAPFVALARGGRPGRPARSTAHRGYVCSGTGYVHTEYSASPLQCRIRRSDGLPGPCPPRDSLRGGRGWKRTASSLARVAAERPHVAGDVDPLSLVLRQDDVACLGIRLVVVRADWDVALGRDLLRAEDA